MAWTFDAKAPVVFVSARAMPLPGWRAAFPDALFVRPGFSTGSRLVFLQMDGEPPLAFEHAGLAGRGMPWIALSNQPDEAFTLTVLDLGAKGAANAHADAVVLQQMAVVAQQGGLWLGESLLQRLLKSVSALPGSNLNTALLERLTPREKEVALRVAHGDSNKEVARALEITERTVKLHVGAVLQKLGARDRLHLSILLNSGKTPAV